jgi:hypothetical protein
VSVFGIDSLLNGRILGLGGLVSHFCDYPTLKSVASNNENQKKPACRHFSWLGGGERQAVIEHVPIYPDKEIH